MKGGCDGSSGAEGNEAEFLEFILQLSGVWRVLTGFSLYRRNRSPDLHLNQVTRDAGKAQS